MRIELIDAYKNNWLPKAIEELCVDERVDIISTTYKMTTEKEIQSIVLSDSLNNRNIIKDLVSERRSYKEISVLLLGLISVVNETDINPLVRSLCVSITNMSEPLPITFESKLGGLNLGAVHIDKIQSYVSANRTLYMNKNGHLVY